MLYLLLAALLYSFLAPVVYRWMGKYAVWLQAGVAFTLFSYFCTLLPIVLDGSTYSEVHLWVPSLAIQLHFYVDGLALLFALLISGFGTLIMIYAGEYLKGHPLLGRFYMYLTLFMVAMLGVVTSGNLISLFVFWELTSISSYLLIGFGHEKDEARSSALQALLVTGTGGLALMAGFILLGMAGDSYNITELLTRNNTIITSSLYLPAVILILVGAFTKSAQFPFHFWLPNAMAAPTPVSAYLHSATMVKAGIYLLARLAPALSGPDVWHISLLVAGSITTLLGAYLALQHTDLKAILAYTTISALGILVTLIGVGTLQAFQAMVVFLLAHALYKGTLFLVAGNLDHATGTREVQQLQGLRKPMLLTGIAAMLAALSMAGVLPFFGFIAKELLYEANLGSSAILFIVSFLSGVAFAALALVLGYRIFWFKKDEPTPIIHPDKLWLAIPPLILAFTSLFIGLMPGLLAAPLLKQATISSAGPIDAFKLSLWHGFTPVLALSLLTLALGFIVYRFIPFMWRLGVRSATFYSFGPGALYNHLLNGLQTGAKYLTAFIQNGYLRRYIATIVLTLVLLLILALWYNSPPLMLSEQAHLLNDIRLHEWGLLMMTFPVLYMVLTTRSRLTAIAVLGIIGYTAALFYILFGAPDIAATQLLIETLTVVLFVLVMHKLPRYRLQSHARHRYKFILVSLLFGATMTYVLLLIKQYPLFSELKKYYGENAYLLGKGKNMVNVILVDFRALDTLGEITVLAVAAVGIYALLKLRMEKGEKQ